MHFILLWFKKVRSGSTKYNQNNFVDYYHLNFLFCPMAISRFALTSALCLAISCVIPHAEFPRPNKKP